MFVTCGLDIAINKYNCNCNIVRSFSSLAKLYNYRINRANNNNNGINSDSRHLLPIIDDKVDKFKSVLPVPNRNKFIQLLLLNKHKSNNITNTTTDHTHIKLDNNNKIDVTTITYNELDVILRNNTNNKLIIELYNAYTNQLINLINLDKSYLNISQINKLCLLTDYSILFTINSANSIELGNKLLLKTEKLIKSNLSNNSIRINRLTKSYNLIIDKLVALNKNKSALKLIERMINNNLFDFNSYNKLIVDQAIHNKDWTLFYTIIKHSITNDNVKYNPLTLTHFNRILNYIIQFRDTYNNYAQNNIVGITANGNNPDGANDSTNVTNSIRTLVNELLDLIKNKYNYSLNTCSYVALIKLIDYNSDTNNHQFYSIINEIKSSKIKFTDNLLIPIIDHCTYINHYTAIFALLTEIQNNQKKLVAHNNKAHYVYNSMGFYSVAVYNKLFRALLSHNNQAHFAYILQLWRLMRTNSIYPSKSIYYLLINKCGQYKEWGLVWQLHDNYKQLFLVNPQYNINIQWLRSCKLISSVVSACINANQSSHLNLIATLFTKSLNKVKASTFVTKSYDLFIHSFSLITRGFINRLDNKGFDTFVNELNTNDNSCLLFTEQYFIKSIQSIQTYQQQLLFIPILLQLIITKHKYLSDNIVRQLLHMTKTVAKNENSTVDVDIDDFISSSAWIQFANMFNISTDNNDVSKRGYRILIVNKLCRQLNTIINSNNKQATFDGIINEISDINNNPKFISNKLANIDSNLSTNDHDESESTDEVDENNTAENVQHQQLH